MNERPANDEQAEFASMTSNAAHTPGRLKMSFAASATANGSVAVYLVDETGRKVGTIWGCEGERAFTADRIVCAWNAAHDAGLSTEALEAGVVAGMAERIEYLEAALADAEDIARAGKATPQRLGDDIHELARIAMTTTVEGDSPKQSQEERG